jgi:hypothetical protein
MPGMSFMSEDVQSNQSVLPAESAVRKRHFLFPSTRVSPLVHQRDLDEPSRLQQRVIDLAQPLGRRLREERLKKIQGGMVQ